jgi:hypothetical protein
VKATVDNCSTTITSERPTWVRSREERVKKPSGVRRQAFGDQLTPYP